MTDSSQKPLNLWLLTDNKPGHRNQLQGLLQALEVLTPVNVKWVDCQQLSLSWWDVVRRNFPNDDHHVAPDLAIAAGHRTHKALLAVRRCYGAFATVLMKPSLPLNLFDAAIIPRHDLAHSNRPHVLITDGVLNTVRPSSATDDSTGLILLGGDSKHYHFDVDAVVAQVGALLQRWPDRHWQLSDSRRTPSSCLPQLAQLQADNLSMTPWQHTESGWVAQQMNSAGMIWVTPDSVSMLYEALTAGVPVGLFELATKGRGGRVVRGVSDLANRSMVNRFSALTGSGNIHPPAAPLWEAKRAAAWLLARCQMSTKKS